MYKEKKKSSWNHRFIKAEFTFHIFILYTYYINLCFFIMPTFLHFYIHWWRLEDKWATVETLSTRICNIFDKILIWQTQIWPCLADLFPRVSGCYNHSQWCSNSRSLERGCSALKHTFWTYHKNTVKSFHTLSPLCLMVDVMWHQEECVVTVLSPVVWCGHTHTLSP